VRRLRPEAALNGVVRSGRDRRRVTCRCKDDYFTSGGGYERCLTFDETRATLGLVRRDADDAAGALYRFARCSAGAQTRGEACAATDFAPSLGWTYLADGRAFGEDCAMECAPDSNQHGVRENATRSDASAWCAVRCVECDHSAWPVSVTSQRLPRTAFEISTACVPTCLSNSGFYAGADARTCLFCPLDACPRGTFWSELDNCTVCAPCKRRLADSEFTASGPFNDGAASNEYCPNGSFQSAAPTGPSNDGATWTPHSAVRCRTDLEYAIAGTPTADARCGTCAD
jgi:hypothetical protein